MKLSDAIPKQRAKWPEATVSDEHDIFFFAKTFARTGTTLGPTYLFRGCADSSWDLRPSFLRLLPPGVELQIALRMERQMLETYMREFPAYRGEANGPDSRDQLDWWVFMQHHGAPTRLLDWTASFLVAAYFAIQAPNGADGAIWHFAAGELYDRARDTYPDLLESENDFFVERHPSILLPVPARRYWARRMSAQQGHVTVSTNLFDLHDEVIARYLVKENGTTPKQRKFGRVIIPSKQKDTIARQLLSMNLTGQALFPGVEGLGRSMCERLRLWQKKDQPRAEESGTRGG